MKIERLIKALKPDFMKIIIAYILSFFFISLNDSFYWCFIIKSKEYCNPNFTQVFLINFSISLLSPWNVLTRILRDSVIEKNFIDILMTFFFITISYLISCILVFAKGKIKGSTFPKKRKVKLIRRFKL